jgi:hypothetical protein
MLECNNLGPHPLPGLPVRYRAASFRPGSHGRRSPPPPLDPAGARRPCRGSAPTSPWAGAATATATATRRAVAGPGSVSALGGAAPNRTGFPVPTSSRSEWKTLAMLIRALLRSDPIRFLFRCLFTAAPSFFLKKDAAPSLPGVDLDSFPRQIEHLSCFGGIQVPEYLASSGDIYNSCRHGIFWALFFKKRYAWCPCGAHAWCSFKGNPSLRSTVKSAPYGRSQTYVKETLLAHSIPFLSCHALAHDTT